MSDLASDYENESRAPSKPQQKPVEVFLSTEEVAPELELNNPVYRKVPKRKTLPLCGICKKKMLAGEKGWHTQVEDNNWWWCIQCIRAPSQSN
jgi:hypothetical protein